MPRKRELKDGPHFNVGDRVQSVFDKKLGTVITYVGHDQYEVKDDDGLLWVAYPTVDIYKARVDE